MGFTFVLPDLETPICALFSRATNPHYQAAAQESRDWLDTFDFFAEKKRAHFHQW